MDNSSNTILVAGATGYLGRCVVEAAVRRGYQVKALVRDQQRTPLRKSPQVKTVVAQATHPEELQGICSGVDFVFSSIGITRQKGFTYEQVDYGVNHALLQEALTANVTRFIYVSVLNPERFRGNPMIEAKERFCRELESSGQPYTILRPTGFFNDISEFFTMAESGRVYLPGKGSNRLNPISGTDLAEAAMDSLTRDKKEIEIGGPEVFTLNGIAELAFRVLAREERITHLPYALLRTLLLLLRPISRRLFTIGDFMLRGSRRDMVAPCYGRYTLEDHFTVLSGQHPIYTTEEDSE